MHILPALSDNYMYILEDSTTKEAAVVDPVDYERVLSKVKELNVKLTKILTTHHHYDHAGGNSDLFTRFKERSLTVFGGDDRIGSITNIVKDGDTINVGDLEIKCLFTPCHTTGHICYFVNKRNSDSDPCVFTGGELLLVKKRKEKVS